MSVIEDFASIAERLKQIEQEEKQSPPVEVIEVPRPPLDFSIVWARYFGGVCKYE